jgi:membrane-bound lytic murein transglycosylase D
MIRQGSTLLIPTSGADPGLSLASLAGPGEKVTHRVRRGETLGQIARAYGTSVRAIQLWNHISDPHRVRAGQSLVVYAGVRQAAPFNQTDSVVSPRPTSPGDVQGTSPTALSVHHVRRGDSLWKIARQHGMTVEELRRANPKLQTSNVIRPGDRLMVSSAAPSGRLIVHRVSRGETLWDIADRYGTTVSKIRTWNGMGRRESLIRPGDQIKLYR